MVTFNEFNPRIRLNPWVVGSSPTIPARAEEQINLWAVNKYTWGMCSYGETLYLKENGGVA